MRDNPWVTTRSVAVLAAVLLATAACGGGEDRTLRVEFDGSSCVYDGPETLSAGSVELDFLNEGSGKASIAFVRHDPGRTFQDMIDYTGEEPSTLHAPEWTTHMDTWQAVSVGDTFHWEGELVAGLYTLACANRTPHNVWLGAGVTVTDD